MKTNLRITAVIAALVCVTASSYGEVYINGKSQKTLEIEKLAVSQQKTIALLEQQVRALEQANRVKQREIDGHRYDFWITLGWMLASGFTGAMLAKVVDCIWKRREGAQDPPPDA